MILVVSIHFLRISKLEFVSLVQKGSIILFPIISKQARAIKKKQTKKRFHVIKKNNAVKSKLESNQSKQTATSNINAVYIQIHKQLGIYSKARNYQVYSYISIRGQQPHFSPLIQINYIFITRYLAPATHSNYIPKDYTVIVPKVITEVLAGSSRSDNN